MRALIKKIKNTLFISVPEDYDMAYQVDSAHRNNARFAVLPFFNIATQLACYVIYLYIYPAAHPELPVLDRGFFSVFSSVYIVVNLLLSFIFIWLRRHEDHPNALRSSQIAVVVFLLCYVFFESLETTLEVEISHNIYRFLTTFVVVALLPLLPRLVKTGIMALYILFVEIGFAWLIKDGSESVVVNAYPQIVIGVFFAMFAFMLIVHASSLRTFILTQSLLELNEQLHLLTVTDPLTSLYNRRAFNEYGGKT